MKRPRLFLPALLASIAVWSCGKAPSGASAEEPPAPAPAETPKAEPPKEAPAKAPPAPAALPAGELPAVVGRIAWEGEIPERAAVDMSSHDKCKAAHTAAPRDEEIVVGPEKGLQNVFVYVKEGLGDKKFDPPATPVELDQNGCVFVPHVVGIQPGQELKMKSSDPVEHNLHSLPTEQAAFNETVKPEGELVKKFEKPENVKIKCDIHSWMGAWVCVVSHPYFAVSNANGEFKIAKLPAGTYKVAAWHEALGEQVQDVTVEEGKAATANFTFKETP